MSTTLTPGVCIACGKDAWRRAAHAKTGTVTALWPDPLSTYASCATPTGYAPGLPYCRDCRPIIGTTLPVEVTFGDGERTASLGEVIDIVPAPLRYGAWYTQQFGEWLPAWLRDHMELSDTNAAPIVAQWRADATAVKGLYGRPTDAQHA